VSRELRSASAIIDAEREVQHTPARVYAFLARLDNHLCLGGRALSVSGLDEDGRGGHIVVSTPVGLRRNARMVVTTADGSGCFGGVAQVGRSTRAHVRWNVGPTSLGSWVALESIICSTSALDRTLLVLGGRWWLRRAFRRTLETLADALDNHYEARFEI